MKSMKTPSKLSRIDVLLNQFLIRIIFHVYVFFNQWCTVLIKKDKEFNTIGYIGLKNKTNSWPYLAGFESPVWDDTILSAFQNMLTHIVLLSIAMPIYNTYHV